MRLGFQGPDPATDFRGMGLLGLHQLLYLATHHAGSGLVQQCRAAARGAGGGGGGGGGGGNFPLSIAGINLSQARGILLAPLYPHSVPSAPPVRGPPPRLPWSRSCCYDTWPPTRRR